MIGIYQSYTLVKFLINYRPQPSASAQHQEFLPLLRRYQRGDQHRVRARDAVRRFVAGPFPFPAAAWAFLF